MGFPNCENHRELLPPKVRLNTDDLAAQMQGYLGIEHHADGSHGDVTADAIDTGPITVVSDACWISLYQENAAGNRTLVGRLCQEPVDHGPAVPQGTRILLTGADGTGEEVAVRVTGGVDVARLGVATIGGLEQQFFDALSAQGKFKLYGQSTTSAASGLPICGDSSVHAPRYSAYAITGGTSVNGIQTSNVTEGGRGQLLILWNNSATSILFEHDTIATPFMRLLCPGNVNFTLAPQTTAMWLYDIAALRWRCIGGTFQSTSGGGAGGMNLDYLGNYVAGPVYNDGDIVVAADGIAYLCVVDGTTTPPEPWPGVGIATSVGPPGPPGATGPPGPPGADGVNAAVDASYWTVTAHPGLTSERALNSLVNGYVKSTAGEPSTIAVIPVSEGGTGATTPPLARTNLGLGTMAVQNADAVAITGGTIRVSTVEAIEFVNIMGTAQPALFFSEAAQNIRWQNSEQGRTLFWTSFNFDFSSPFPAMSLTPTGLVTAPQFSGGGSNLTNLVASNLAFGTVPLPRLGTNAPAVGTFLAWDNQWRLPPTTDPFPSGLIVLSDTPCPPGWTRVNWDGSFLRVNATAGGTGGSGTHAHAAGALAVNAHAHGGATGPVAVSISGVTSNDGAHAHPFSGHIDGVTSGGGGSVQTADAGGSFQTLTPPHTHTFGADYAGTTGSAGAHTHGFSGSGSGTGSIPSDAPGINGTTALASNVPPYIDVILCRKN